MTEKLLLSMRGGGDRGARWERNLMGTKWRSYSIYSSKFTTAIKRQTAAEEVEEWRLEGQRRGIKKSNKSMDGSFEIGSREIGEKMTKVVNQWWLAHRLDTIFKKKKQRSLTQWWPEPFLPPQVCEQETCNNRQHQESQKGCTSAISSTLWLCFT